MYTQVLAGAGGLSEGSTGEGPAFKFSHGCWPDSTLHRLLD